MTDAIARRREIAGFHGRRVGDAILPGDRVPHANARGASLAWVAPQRVDPAAGRWRAHSVRVRERRVVTRCGNHATPVRRRNAYGESRDVLRDIWSRGCICEIGCARRRQPQCAGRWQDRRLHRSRARTIRHIGAAERLAASQLNGGEIGLVQLSRELAEIAFRTGAEDPAVVQLAGDRRGAVPTVVAVGFEGRHQAGDIFGVGEIVVEDARGRARRQAGRRDQAPDPLCTNFLDVRPPCRLTEHVVLLRDETQGHAAIGAQQDVAVDALADNQHDPGSELGGGEARRVAPRQIVVDKLHERDLRAFGVAAVRRREASCDGGGGEPLHIARAEELVLRGGGSGGRRRGDVSHHHRPLALQAARRFHGGRLAQRFFESRVERRHAQTPARLRGAAASAAAWAMPLL